MGHQQAAATLRPKGSASARIASVLGPAFNVDSDEYAGLEDCDDSTARA